MEECLICFNKKTNLIFHYKPKFPRKCPYCRIYYQKENENKP